MSHHHDHDHSHNHHHHHDDAAPSMTFGDKLNALLAHWAKHNDDHAANYRKWAEDARAHGLAEAAERLTEAADETDRITALFEAARNTLKTGSGS